MAEIGESSGGGSGQDGKRQPQEFAARITSLEFVDSVTVTLDGAPVAAPHWTLATKNDLQDWSRQAKRMKTARRSYSKKPAAYTLPGGRQVKLEIEVTKSKSVSGSGEVTGTLGPLVIQGTCPTAVGKHIVDATITAWTDAIDAQVGKLPWLISLKEPALSASLGSTFVEVYLLMDKPGKMYSGGVPAEVLRFLTRKAKVLGKRAAKEVGAAVTSYTHSSHGLTYDTVDGRSAYRVAYPNGATINFPVVDYALRRYETVNCYDQAAAVQSLSGAVGASIDWIFMRPYGFINPTKLIGVKGLCNNPFYLAENPVDGAVNNPQYLDRDDPRRSAFGNHAFCSIAGEILDACAGPHLATESLAQYIAAAIDQTTKRNRDYLGLPGTPANATTCPGIISTKTSSSR